MIKRAYVFMLGCETQIHTPSFIHTYTYYIYVNRDRIAVNIVTQKSATASLKRNLLKKRKKHTLNCYIQRSLNNLELSCDLHCMRMDIISKGKFRTHKHRKSICVIY